MLVAVRVGFGVRVEVLVAVLVGLGVRVPVIVEVGRAVRVPVGAGDGVLVEVDNDVPVDVGFAVAVIAAVAAIVGAGDALTAPTGALTIGVLVATGVGRRVLRTVGVGSGVSSGSPISTGVGFAAGLFTIPGTGNVGSGAGAGVCSGELVSSVHSPLLVSGLPCAICQC